MTNAPQRSTIQCIAEVQWQIDSGSRPGPRVAGAPHEPVGRHDESMMFIHRFRAAVHGQGFQRSDDLRPYGTPIIAYEPALRMHSQRQQGLSYEIGAGTFAVRATQPVAWEDFSAALREGMKVVLAGRDYDAQKQPFSYITLHVVQAFQEPWTHQQGLDEFLKDALGIQVVLPQGIAQHVRPGYRYQPLLQLQIYSDNQRELSVAVKPDYLNDQFAYLVDTTVATQDSDIYELDAVVHAVDASHAMLQGLFGDIPAPQG